MRERFHTGLVVAVLLLVGVLLGSGLLEWGDRRQANSADPAPANQAARATIGAERERVSVEVLNGAGVIGAAARVSNRLRDMGFDVKTFGNATDFDQESSVLIDRSGRAWAAKAIADSLGGVPIRSSPAPELYLDATLILGPDWERLLAR
ncbi:MAG: LytR C-terminal domain-containing protein [Gemmatimonadota bacterium]|nr:LytR C-terminal domain-containing protein [Gemmatimonadota bacterium]